MSKNRIKKNRLKKFMQVEVDVICTHTNFGGRSSFGDIFILPNFDIATHVHALLPTD